MKQEEIISLIDTVINDYKGAITKNTHKRTKRFYEQFIKDLEYIKNRIEKEVGK